MMSRTPFLGCVWCLAMLLCSQPTLCTTVEMRTLLQECNCEVPLAVETFTSQRGMALVYDGYFEEGLLELEREIEHTSSDATRQHLRKQYGTALFHVGTVHNCVVPSSRDKCALPIQPGDEHYEFEMYSRSVQAFTVMLAEDDRLRVAGPDRRARRSIASNCVNFMLAFTGNRTLVEPLSSLLWAQDTLSLYSTALEYATAGAPVSTSGIFYEDVAQRMGLDLVLPAAAFGTADFNEDGLTDVVLCGWLDSYKLEIRMNTLDEFKMRAGAPFGVETLRGGSKITVGDVNNDGHVDLFVTRGSWRNDGGALPPNSLLMGRGDGTFEDRTIEAGLLEPRLGTQPALFLDWNLDGWVDIVVCNELTQRSPRESIQLFMNNGDGTFTDQWSAVGYSFKGWCRGVVQVDADGDVYPDIAVSDFSRSFVTVIPNPGNGSTATSRPVVLRTNTLFPANNVSPFSLASADFDNDGVQELVVSSASNQATPMDLFVVKRNGRHWRTWFVSHGAQLCPGCDIAAIGMGLGITDADNDGWLDLAVGLGPPDIQDIVPDRLLRNVVPQSSSAKFVDVALEPDVKFADVAPGHTICSFDYDNDGDLDLLKSSGGKFEGDAGRVALLRNGASERLQHHKWLSVKLVGTNSNREAIGAKVEVRVALADGSSQSMFRWVQQSSSFGCEQARLHVGLGAASSIEHVRVFWPFLKEGGELVTDVFVDVDMNSFIVIREGKEDIEYVQY